MDTEQRAASPATEHAQMLRVPGFTLRRGVHPSGSQLPRHAHDDPTLCYVMHGRFTEHSAGRVAECQPDGLKLTPAGETHWNRFLADETRGLRIDVERTRFQDNPDIHRVLDERLEIAGGEPASLVRRVLSQLEVADFAAPLAVEGLLLELVATLARETVPAVRSHRPRWLLQADALIHDRYTSSIALADVAQAVGVTPATLARAYRRAFRTSVGERVRRLRVQQAARELAQTSEPLSAIALRAGFFDQSHFSNVFRRHTGMSPGRYRAALRRAPRRLA